MSPSSRALDGILVLDVGSFLAGPSAATVMSDFGAEVIVPMADGAFRTVSNPVSVAGQPKVPAGRAPELGEHTEEILRRLGYDAPGIATLRRLGMIPP